MALTKTSITHLVIISLLAAIPLTAQARIVRSQAAKNHFKATHPCPTNGNRHGSCPGYVIDHIKALACGGADAPRNDAWERIGCKTKPSIKLAAISVDYYTGAKGGCYTYSKSAKKRYVDPSFCRDKS
ncbi:MAG: hypothetical protein RIQ94_1345 [Pseudomonadota bacterium]